VSAHDRGSRARLIAAYRQGLGVAPLAVIGGPAGIRLVAAGQGEDSPLSDAEIMHARWWCRRAVDAERVIAAAAAQLRRSESYDAALAAEAVGRAAKRLHVALQTEQDLIEQALAVIERIDVEVDRMQRSGELKSVNKSYRAYRIEATARGERIARYADWMSDYRANLVRKLAATLRSL
jgi:hypothetical protein